MNLYFEAKHFYPIEIRATMMAEHIFNNLTPDNITELKTLGWEISSTSPKGLLHEDGSYVLGDLPTALLLLNYFDFSDEDEEKEELAAAKRRVEEATEEATEEAFQEVLKELELQDKMAIIEKAIEDSLGYDWFMDVFSNPPNPENILSDERFKDEAYFVVHSAADMDKVMALFNKNWYREQSFIKRSGILPFVFWFDGNRAIAKAELIDNTIYCVTFNKK